MSANLSNGGSNNPILLLSDDSDDSIDYRNNNVVQIGRSEENNNQRKPVSSLDHRAPSDQASRCDHRVFSNDHDRTTGDKTDEEKSEIDHDEIDVSLEPPLKKVRQEEALNVEKENLMITAVNEAKPSVMTESTSIHSMDLKLKNNGTRCLPTASSASSIEYDTNYASRVDLTELPEDVQDLPHLTARDLAELEYALQIEKEYPGAEKNGWKNDWSGNLELIKKDILLDMHRISENPHMRRSKKAFCDWVTDNAKSADDFRGIQLLFSFIYHMHGTPPTAKKILAYSLQRPAGSREERRKFIDEAIRRTSYDPHVLTEDGWTTQKADTPDGSHGGAYLIGKYILWEGYRAIIIAFVKDDDRDLWKALWTDDNETFDLESDELQEGFKKWEQKIAKLKKIKEVTQPLVIGNPKTAKSWRYEANRNFNVEGAEHGIVLAMPSFDAISKPGIYWPARILHVKECKNSMSQGSTRRNSSRSMIELVFLAPYWNGNVPRGKEMLIGQEPDAVRSDVFSSGTLFDYATVEASDEMISKYPYDCYDVISIDKLRAEFSLTGLPQSAFPRFLDSHRLAMALRLYARLHLTNTMKLSNDTATLTESHPMSVRAPDFSSVVLNLPYDYILSKLPHPSNLLRNVDGEDLKEDVFKIKHILESMSPPHCWDVGEKSDGREDDQSALLSPLKSPIHVPNLNPSEALDLCHFTRNDFFLKLVGDECCENPEIKILGEQLKYLLSQLNSMRLITMGLRSNEVKDYVDSFLSKCLHIKAFGDDCFSGVLRFNIDFDGGRVLVCEWRKICEKMYRMAKMSSVLETVNKTTVLTDSRCNQHITANGSVERAVRLPAALVGAKRAGAGSSNSGILLITKVEDEYLDLAEKKIIPMAHKSTYIKRLKTKICSLTNDAKGVPLTEDSDGEGGEDTVGSRGSYTAAVAAVAAALKGVDMVVGADSVNAFCAVRPPGHHAGRDLRPMKAVSNGFCLLNAVACAALYAVTPKTNGGLGLKRVCIIDFDVHHGNGTQDILCSTYDPRFLYVSTHAGGVSINGFDEDDSENDYLGSRSRKKIDGIFPGRCGDFSPHEGVLNIPLGKQVTTHALGLALSSKISNAVETFSPDLILLSAGFDAHKNDPMDLGSLSAADFGIVTKLLCEMAHKVCSGRLLSILEGGYGVPCCRSLQRNLFLPDRTEITNLKVMDLGNEMPETMEDDIEAELIKKTDRCHQEGFLDCVREHVESLHKNTSIS